MSGIVRIVNGEVVRTPTASAAVPRAAGSNIFRLADLLQRDRTDASDAQCQMLRDAIAETSAFLERADAERNSGPDTRATLDQAAALQARTEALFRQHQGGEAAAPAAEPSQESEETKVAAETETGQRVNGAPFHLAGDVVHSTQCVIL